MSALTWCSKRDGIDTAEWAQDGYDMRARMPYDTDYQPFYARFIDSPKDAAPDEIVLRRDPRLVQRGACEWVAVGDVDKTDTEWHKHAAQSRAMLEAVNRGDVGAYGVVVTASRAGVVLGQSSVWGIEVGYPIDRVEIDSYVDDCAADAIAEANTTLAKLCASIMAAP
jgi:hypothetical protein